MLVKYPPEVEHEGIFGYTGGIGHGQTILPLAYGVPAAIYKV
jgi:hypothetical protein